MVIVFKIKMCFFLVFLLEIVKIVKLLLFVSNLELEIVVKLIYFCVVIYSLL